MKLRNAILSGLMFGMAHGMSPVRAEPTKGYFTMDAMGCMLLKECTEGVEKITSSKDLRKEYPGANWDVVADEFDKIMESFSQIGVDVHLADPKYFPVGHRGVYHTVSNHFYLNKSFMHRPHVLMSVVRHCLLYTSPSPRDATLSRMPSSA